MQELYHPEDPRHYLRAELNSRLQRRPHYSLRAFARDLELSPSTVSDFLNGKMGFSRDRIWHLSKKLNLTEQQRDHWWDLLESQFSRNPEERRLAKVRTRARTLESKNRMALEQFQVISEWQHFAILELIEVSDQYHAPDLLASALGLPLKVIKQSLDRLEKLVLIERAEKPWKVTTQASTLGDAQVSSRALRDFHLQCLNKAQRALEEQPPESRENQTLIFGLNETLLPQMKNELHEALLKVAMKFADHEGKNNVYCLSSHLFSLLEKRKALT